MQALYRDAGGIRLIEAEIPMPPSGEALIKVRLTGICRTDLEIAKGYMSFSGIPGHEFVGEVARLNEADANRQADLIGKRIVGEINCGCGGAITADPVWNGIVQIALFSGFWGATAHWRSI